MDFSKLWDIVTSAGAIAIPIAIWWVRQEVKNGNAAITLNQALISEKVENHILNDEGYQERADKFQEQVKARLNII